jgi:hypothetical protein
MKPGYLALGILLLGVGFSLLYMHVGGYTIREVTATATLYKTVTYSVTVTKQYPLSGLPKLRNVKISIENLSFNASELWIIDALADETFREGGCSTSNSLLSVLIVFPNNTRRATHLPSGTTLCPESILLEVSEFSIRHEPLPEWKATLFPELKSPEIIEPEKSDYPSLAYILLAGLTVLAGLATIAYSITKEKT